ncbi:hypothetical protein CK203_043888 [Vitis vinifera]|uniref:Uncharacterized protein n=1 Tax=Vitis vinifera TaxID=29760 RepID=A0A438HVF2_VITVI|nr:hypothetical protein CK203_043888 [Vitis vinifera]
MSHHSWQAREMFGEQANLIGQWKPNSNAPYGNTYNSSWRTTQTLHGSQGQTHISHQPNQANRVKVNPQLSKHSLINLNTVNEKGKFPSQPHQNPKGYMKWNPKMRILQRHDEEAHASSISSTLRGKKPIKNASEILDVLRQVKQAFLNRASECYNPMQVSNQIQRSGCPTISVNIGGTQVEKALLDLGNVNLLPYSVYKELGLGELKPTSITLSLADRSVKSLGGNGVMQLTFGNMTLELNIFHLCQKHIHPEEDEGPEEVCMIDTLVEEHCNQSILDQFEENPDESHEDLDDGLAEPMGMNVVMSNWRQKSVILPLFKDEEEMKEAKDAILKLELKTLPAELKYAYLEEGNKAPVEGAKPTRQPQRRLNPHMQEVVRAEVLKLLQAGIIYPISDSTWVSSNPSCSKEVRDNRSQGENGDEVPHASQLVGGCALTTGS